MFYKEIESPIGPLLLAGDHEALRFLLFKRGRDKAKPKADWEPDRSVLKEPVKQIGAYFSGRLKAFDLPLAPRGTPFQASVWDALQRIPYGETISYGELARRLGNPKAVRAVGLANGSNPIAMPRSKMSASRSVSKFVRPRWRIAPPSRSSFRWPSASR